MNSEKGQKTTLAFPFTKGQINKTHISITTVFGIVAVIAHNKNKSLRDRHLSVIGMKGLLDIAFINGFPIDEGLAISDFNGIPANSNDTLDEITPRITGVLEDNDFPRCGSRR